jgi:Na+/proline symporter
VVTDGRLTITSSIWAIGIVAVGWTLLGGIATVIWTDLLLFLVFVAGAVVSTIYIAHLLPGGLGEIISAGAEADKFRVFDFSTDPTLDFTIWAGLIACTVFNLNAFGTDQLIAQRMFCCKSARSARWAIISSSAGMLITAAMMLVGVGLFAYYQRFDMNPLYAAAVADKGDRVFPIFIVRVLPAGLTGLLVAGIFAAAVSSLDSILAALSQTVISVAYRPYRRWRAARTTTRSASDPVEQQRRELRASRLLVVLWGLALCGMAHLSEQASRFQPDILRLALSMAGYTGGALLAGFMLAFLKLEVDDRGLLWSGPISVLMVFAVAWHQPWSHWVCRVGAGMILAVWLWHLWPPQRRSEAPKTLWLVAILAAVVLISRYGYWPGPPDPATGLPTYRTIAWPWFVPIGFAVAFSLGYLLAGRRAGDTGQQRAEARGEQR